MDIFCGSCWGNKLPDAGPAQLMGSAAEAIHDRDPESFLRQCFRHNAIEVSVIEFAELAKEIRGRFAQVAGPAQSSRFDERLREWFIRPKERPVTFATRD